MKDDLGDEPAGGPDDEERSLQGIGRVEEELHLFPYAQVLRAHDLDEPPADVVAVPLGPAHALASEPSEGCYALCRRLRVRGVDDLEAEGIKPQRQLPVLGEAATPTQLAEEVG